MSPLLPVLHEDDDLVVVDKPAGLRSTREHDDDDASVEGRITAQRGRRLWAVHQLDRDTSGVLLFVTRRALVIDWQKRLAAGSKRYLALVHGLVTGDKHTIEARLRRDRRQARTVVDDRGQTASTSVRVIGRGDDVTAVLCQPHQGRTHQVRVHLAHLGHPLLGDARYGGPPSMSRHALHLWQLKVAGRAFVAPLPDDLSSAAQKAQIALGERPPR